ncbi:MAG: hypothetical protein ACT6FG_05310 [Methanosarcinaceae archaeon]
MSACRSGGPLLTVHGCARENIRCVINADLNWHDYYLDYKCLGIVANIVDDTAHDVDNINHGKRLMQEILSVKLKETGLQRHSIIVLMQDIKYSSHLIMERSGGLV